MLSGKMKESLHEIESTLTLLLIDLGNFFRDGLVDTHTSGRVKDLSHESGVKTTWYSDYPR